MRRLVLPLTAGVVFCVIFLSSRPAPASAQAVPTDVQQAALAGDWNRVWTILGAEKTNPEPAELRLIKGHACLALNYNNQSLELFASALNDADRQAWQTWADTFAQEHQDNAIAWYFQGDAHARLKEWKAATECFDKSISLDPNCCLALNARGVVTHAVGNTILARQFFVKAVKAKGDFADAYASRGTLNVFLNSAQGYEDFVTAKSRSRDETPILPIIGVGCTLYGQGDYEQARGQFRAVPRNSPLCSLAESNQLAVELERLGRAVKDAAVAGMFIEALQVPLDGSGKVDVQTGQAPQEFHSWSLDWEVEIEVGIPDVFKIRGRWKPKEDTKPGEAKPGEAKPGEAKPGEAKPGDGGVGGTVDVEAIRIPPELRHPRIDILTSPIHQGPRISVVDFANAVHAATSKVQQQVSEFSAMPRVGTDRFTAPQVVTNGSPIGGVTSDPRNVRVKRGPSAVCTVYGLLYAVPVDAVATQSRRPNG